MVFLLPEWANTPKEYKKGGKVKKARKPKKAKKSKAGDTVILRKGNVPHDGGVGIAQRMMTPGNVFGGGLPAPLQTVSYASAPAVARPISRMEFVGSSDAYYNRNRNKTDDVQIDVNPADIKPDVKPSIRFQNSSNPNAFPPVQYTMYNQSNWYGEVPRLNEIQTRPSVRAMASQPSTGWNLTHTPILMDVSGVGHFDSDERLPYNVAQSAFEPEEPQEEEGLGAVPIPLNAPRVKVFTDEQGKVIGKKYIKKPILAPTAERAVRHQMKTLKDVHEAGFEDYDEAIEAYKQGNVKMKRGGRVKSVF